MSDGVAGVGDSIRARLTEIAGEVQGTEDGIKALQASIKPLTDERKTLQKMLSVLEGATSTNGKAEKPEGVPYESIERVLVEAGEPRTTQQIAEVLGVKPNQIARKLKKLVDDGAIGGTKEAGFVALAAPVAAA